SEPARIRSGVAEAPPSSFRLPSHLNDVYSVKVTNESAGGVAAATSREFASGQRLFGRFTLVKVLGRGGMGIVWLARDEELERNVALKFIPDLMIQDRVVFDQLKREAKRCLELTHPHIVRFTTSYTTNARAAFRWNISMAKRYRTCEPRKSRKSLSRKRSLAG